MLQVRKQRPWARRDANLPALGWGLVDGVAIPLHHNSMRSACDTGAEGTIIVCTEYVKGVTVFGRTGMAGLLRFGIRGHEPATEYPKERATTRPRPYRVRPRPP